MNYSIFLNKAYQQFLLDLGGKKVPTPYRINVPFQPDRRLYGKSDAKQLTQDSKDISQEKGFDLNSASVEEIRKFMEENWLGIDCSGLAYHLLDNLLKKTGQGKMQKIGFPKASSTNVAKLTAPEFTEKVEGWEQVKPGDLIRLNSENADHILIVLNSELKTRNSYITYVHSSGITKTTGVHTGEIINGKFPEDLSVFSYNLSIAKISSSASDLKNRKPSAYNGKTGDGIYRLKALTNPDVRT